MMDEIFKTVILRITVFLNQNIPFTKDTFDKLSLIIGHSLEVNQVMVPNAIDAPQNGYLGIKPFEIKWKDDLNRDCKAAFLPGQIDFYFSGELTEDQEGKAVNSCSDWLKKLMEQFGIPGYTRLAFAPSLGFPVNEAPEVYSKIWESTLNEKWLKKHPWPTEKTVGMTFKDKFSHADNEYGMNLLIQLRDGIRTQMDQNGMPVSEDQAVLIQFDINTVVDPNYIFEGDALNTFFKRAKESENELLGIILS